MKKKILVLQKHSPYGSSLARDGLDYILTSAAYDQDMSIAFVGEGVWQLVQSQSPAAIQQKSQLSALEVLSLYDVEQLFVCEEDLHERHLLPSQLGIEVALRSRDQIKTMIKQQDCVLGF